VSAAPTLSHSSGGVSLLGLPIFYLSHFDVVKYAQPPFKWAVRNLVGAEPFILSLPRSTNSAMTIPVPFHSIPLYKAFLYHRYIIAIYPPELEQTASSGGLGSPPSS